MGNLRIRIIAIPYKNFKEKIKITKQFERRYQIEDLAGETKSGVLYMKIKNCFIGGE